MRALRLGSPPLPTWRHARDRTARDREREGGGGGREGRLSEEKPHSCMAGGGEGGSKNGVVGGGDATCCWPVSATAIKHSGGHTTHITNITTTHQQCDGVCKVGGAVGLAGVARAQHKCSCIAWQSTQEVHVAWCAGAGRVCVAVRAGGVVSARQLIADCNNSDTPVPVVQLPAPLRVLM